MKILEVSSQGYIHGFILIDMTRPAMRAVKSIRDGQARLTTQVGLGKLYTSEKAAQKALNTIKEYIYE